MATYFIGDVQGCYDPLQRLLEKINFDPAGDRLCFCGDLVNRGGQSLKVLKLLYRLRRSVVSVLGNHDIRLLAEASRHPNGDSKNREFNKIISHSKGEKLLSWLNQRPLLWQNKQHGIILVHAGLLPQWNLKQARAAAEEIQQLLRGRERDKFIRKIYGGRPPAWKAKLNRWQRVRLSVNTLTRLRYCTPGGKMDLSATGAPGSQQSGYSPWFQLPHQRKSKWTVVFGHWAALGLHLSPGYVGLDSGCVWGGALTAWRLEDRRIFQVDGLNRRRRKR